MNITIIEHKEDGYIIHQRIQDGYVNATAMCKATGKLWGHYYENKVTKEFLDELSRSIGIPINILIKKIITGDNELRGTWIHPQVAINLGQWLSPKFAVKVSKWISDWMNRRIPENKTPAITSNFDITNPTEVIRFLSEVSNVYLKQNEIIKLELDHAIKTKTWIGEKREATAMATASVAVRKVNKLENELGVGRDFNQVRAIWWLKDEFHVNMPGFWSQFGKKLKEFCVYNGYEIKVIPDSKYGKLYNYPVEASDKFRVRLYNNPEILGKFRKYS